MAERELVALNTAKPGLESPQSGDTYLLPRSMHVAAGAQFISKAADGASAVAFSLDTANDLATSGAKLLSLSNQGSEQAYIGKDGDASFAGGELVIGSNGDLKVFREVKSHSGWDLRLRQGHPSQATQIGFSLGQINIAQNDDSTVKICRSSGGLTFFGVSAVGQQAATGTTTGFTAGTGTGVNDDSTFTGNSGTAAYTIGDIVLALKNYGLLAAS